MKLTMIKQLSPVLREGGSKITTSVFTVVGRWELGTGGGWVGGMRSSSPEKSHLLLEFGESLGIPESIGPTSKTPG